jgi:hypothetical protein
MRGAERGERGSNYTRARSGYTWERGVDRRERSGGCTRGRNLWLLGVVLSAIGHFCDHQPTRTRSRVSSKFFASSKTSPLLPSDSQQRLRSLARPRNEFRPLHWKRKSARQDSI